MLIFSQIFLLVLLWLVRRGFVQMQGWLLPLDMYFIAGGKWMCLLSCPCPSTCRRLLVFFVLKSVTVKGED